MPLKHSVRAAQLQNGARGLVVNVPDSTVVSSTIHFRAGNDYAKSPEIQQVAHLMEHMAFGPNAEYATMEDFSLVFSSNGAYSNASTFDTNMHYYADCAQFEWQRILDLQELAITKPRFLPEILAAEKGNVREELSGQSHRNMRVLWQQIGRAMGSESFLDTEKLETIDAVTVNDIIEHHQRTHTLENMRFVIAGNFDDNGDEALRKLESWQLKAGERLAPKQEALHSAPPIVIARLDQTTISFGLAMTVPRVLTNRELLVGSALNHLLTGTLHSRIFGTARSRGICYGMGSNIGADLTGTSSWEFLGQVSPSNAGALMELIVAELQSVVAGQISNDELEAVKRYLTGDYQMRGQTVSALAGWYASDYFFDDTYDEIDTTAERINDITIEDLVSLAQEFIAANTWTLGEIGTVSAAAADEHHRIVAQLFRVYS